jgi:hypothetical protein
LKTIPELPARSMIIAAGRNPPWRKPTECLLQFLGERQIRPEDLPVITVSSAASSNFPTKFQEENHDPYAHCCRWSAVNHAGDALLRFQGKKAKENISARYLGKAGRKRVCVRIGKRLGNETGIGVIFGDLEEFERRLILKLRMICMLAVGVAFVLA